MKLSPVWHPFAEAALPLGDRTILEIDLCTEVARALHRYGTSAPRLEGRLELLSNHLGVPGQFFVTPTAVFASYKISGKVRAHTQLLRVEPGGVNLGRVAEVERLVERVRAGELGVAEAMGAVREIVERPDRRGPVSSIAAAGAICAAAATFFGGGIAEVAVATVMGLLLGLAERFTDGQRTTVRLLPPLFATFVAFSISGLGLVWPTLALATAQLASLIVLVPGLEFTLAIKEVATANLVSGAARLVSAVGEFLALGFGVALGTEVAHGLWGDLPSPVEPAGLPGWTVFVAFAVAAFGFAGRFKASRRDLGWVWVACAVGYGGAALGTQLLGSPLGAFVGAVLVGLASNLYARRSGRSPLVMMVPGIILLVPGSVGFRSFSMLLHHDVISAVETAFTMALTATALSIGLLLANVVVPSD